MLLLNPDSFMTLSARQPSETLPWFGTTGPDDKSGTAEDDFLIGLAGNDTLRGLGGNDALNGQQGADRLFGGTGQDRIYVSGGDVASGGRGADVFVFLDVDRLPEIADPGTARIKDFDAVGTVHDSLELTNFATSWDARDRGMEDGFEMFASRGNVVIRLAGADGTITRIVLEDTRLADIDQGDLFFG